MKKFITILIVTLSVAVTVTMAQQSSWKPLNISAHIDVDIRDIYMVDENVGFAIIYLHLAEPNSMILKTLDAGVTWKELFSGDNLQKMFVFSENSLYLCNLSYKIWKYDGNSFNDAGPDGYYDYSDVFFSSVQTGWACGGCGNIHKTTDGGVNWIHQFSNGTDLLVDIYAIDDNKVWICGNGGILLYTNDGGTNWQKKTLTTTQDLNSVQFVNENLGFVVGYGGIVLKTTNGGLTWVETTLTGLGGNSVHFEDVHFVDESIGYIVGLNGVIFKTIDGGTWIQQESGTTRTIKAVYFLDEDHGWYGEYPGTIAYTDRGGELCTTIADFTVSGQCPGDVVLTNQSSGNFLPAGPQYEWYWDGNIFSTDTNTTYQSVPAGQYQISLKVLDGNCVDTKTVDHIVGAITLDTTFAVTCQAYQWEDSLYSTTTIDIRHYHSIYGCDSTLVLHLTVNPTYEFNETYVICQGETYTWHGVDYTTAGNYTKNYQTVNGCDSTYHLELVLNPVYEFYETHTMCQGETYTWHGTDYTTTGNYTKDYYTVNGCDSTYHLSLTVNPLPELVTVITSPTNGLLSPGALGSVSLSTSYSTTTYWTTKGAAMFSGNITGTGSSLNMGNNYPPGSYDVWSENQMSCKRKQATITFSEQSNSGKMVVTPTYGQNSSLFADGDVKVSVYQSIIDIYGNTVIIPIGSPQNIVSGNAEFNNLNGNYYVKSELVNTNDYPQVIPVYFYGGPTVDSASLITIAPGQVEFLNMNHPTYPDTTGSNTVGGSVDTNAVSKGAGLPDQVVILRHETSGQILSVAVTDANGKYFIAKAPDNAKVQLYVTSFQYQNWTPATVQTGINTHYTVNFIVDGNDVYPESTKIVENTENLKFNVYPNPTSGKVYLENIPKGSILQVFDLQGRCLMMDSRHYRTDLDVSSLAPGTYVLVITSDKNLGVVKLIKQ